MQFLKHILNFSSPKLLKPARAGASHRLLPVLALAFLAMIATPAARAAFIDGSFTNYFGGAYTNVSIIQKCGTSLADGTAYPQGIPIRVYPQPNGWFTNQLAVGNYYITNAALVQGPIYFVVPDDAGPTVYNIYQPGVWHSGGNFFVGGGAGTVTATNVTSSAIINGLGYTPVSYADLIASNNETMLSATNLTQAERNALLLTNTIILTTATNLQFAALQIATNLVNAERAALNATNTLLLLAIANSNAVEIARVTAQINGTNAAVLASTAAALIATNNAILATVLAQLQGTNTALLATTAAALNATNGAILASVLAQLIATNNAIIATATALTAAERTALNATNSALLASTAAAIIATNNAILATTLAQIIGTNAANLALTAANLNATNAQLIITFNSAMNGASNSILATVSTSINGTSNALYLNITNQGASVSNLCAYLRALIGVNTNVLVTTVAGTVNARGTNLWSTVTQSYTNINGLAFWTNTPAGGVAEYVSGVLFYHGSYLVGTPMFTDAGSAPPPVNAFFPGGPVAGANITLTPTAAGILITGAGGGIGSVAAGTNAFVQLSGNVYTINVPVGSFDAPGAAQAATNDLAIVLRALITSSIATATNDLNTVMRAALIATNNAIIASVLAQLQATNNTILTNFNSELNANNISILSQVASQINATNTAILATVAANLAATNAAILATVAAQLLATNNALIVTFNANLNTASNAIVLALISTNANTLAAIVATNVSILASTAAALIATNNALLATFAAQINATNAAILASTAAALIATNNILVTTITSMGNSLTNFITSQSRTFFNSTNDALVPGLFIATLTQTNFLVPSTNTDGGGVFVNISPFFYTNNFTHFTATNNTGLNLMVTLSNSVTMYSYPLSFMGVLTHAWNVGAGQFPPTGAGWGATIDAQNSGLSVTHVQADTAKVAQFALAGSGSLLTNVYFIDTNVFNFCLQHTITDPNIIAKLNWGWSRIIAAGAVQYIGDMELLYRDYNPGANLTWFGSPYTFTGYTLDDYGAVFSPTTTLRVDNMPYDYRTGSVFAVYNYPNAHTSAGKEVGFGFFNPGTFSGNYYYVNSSESHIVQRSGTNAPASGGNMTESNLVYAVQAVANFTFDPSSAGYNDNLDQAWTYEWSGSNCSVWKDAQIGVVNAFNNQPIFTNLLATSPDPLTTFLAGTDLITNSTQPTIPWNGEAQLFVQLKNFPTGNFVTDSNVIVALNSMKLAFSPVTIQNIYWGDSRTGYGQGQLSNSFSFYHQQKYVQPARSYVNVGNSGASFTTTWTGFSSNYWFNIPYPPWIKRNFFWEFGVNDAYLSSKTATQIKAGLDSFRFACITNKAHLYVTTCWGTATNNLVLPYSLSFESVIQQFNLMVYSNSYLYDGIFPMDRVVNMRILNTNNAYSDGVHWGNLASPFTLLGYQVDQAWANCGPIVSGFSTVPDFDGNVNIPEGTIIQTNFIGGGLYLNTFGVPLQVTANAALGASAVSGSSCLGLWVIASPAVGGTTNLSAIQTTALSIAMNYTNMITAFVPTNAIYGFTNLSAGAGDTAVPIGGQIFVY